MCYADMSNLYYYDDERFIRFVRIIENVTMSKRVFGKKERMEINSIKPVVIIDEAVCKIYSCHSFIYISIGRAPKNNPMLGICLFYNIAVLFNNRATIKHHIIDSLNVQGN